MQSDQTVLDSEERDDAEVEREPPRPSPRAGSSLDRYKLLREVGRGGMGVVYAAYDPVLDRKVALKILHSRRDRKPRARERFVREAQAMARIRHPNVVEVFAVGEYDDRVYIAMELVDGYALAQWVKRTRPSWQQVLRVFVEAGRGLDAAHQAGFVHRDFKPGNVLLGKEGRPRVTDFGLVRFASPSHLSELPPERPPAVPAPVPTNVDEACAHLTQAGAQLGTPAYMAPEQLIDPSATDTRSDQFSFGVALYESLFGRLPFKAGTAGFDPPRDPPPKTRVPRWLRRVVFRTLQADPAARFDSMKTVIDHLERRGTPRIRRVAASAVVAASGLAAAASLWSSGEDGRCPTPEEAIEQVWDADRQALVEEAFDRFGAFGNLTHGRLRGRIDEYTSIWSARYASVCATGADRDQRTADVRMACLHGRLSRLDAFANILETADARLVETSVRQAGQLLRDPACDEVDVLVGGALAATGALHPEEGSLRQMLAKCEAQIVAGREDDGLVLALDIIERAQRAGIASVEAEGHLCRAGILETRGNYRLAEESQTAAFWTASEVGADRVALDAALEVVSNVGGSQARFDEGHAWIRHAQSTLERLPPSPRLEADVIDALGLLYFDDGHLQQARAQFEREFEMLAPGSDTTPELRERLYGRLAIVSARQGRYDEAADWGRKSLEAAEEMVGPTHPHLVTGLTNLGMIYYLQGRYDEALGQHTRVIEIWTEHRPEDHPNMGTYLSNRGLSLMELGRYDEAEDHFGRALALRERYLGAEHPHVARVLGNLSNVAREREDYDKAIAYGAKATDLFRRSLGADHHDTAQAATMTAGAMVEAGLLEEALPLLEEAKKTLETTLGPDHPTLAMVLDIHGEVEERQGRPEAAVLEHERALAIYEQNETSPSTLAKTNFAIARTAWDSGDQERAIDRAQQAAALFARARNEREAKVRDWLARHRPAED